MNNNRAVAVLTVAALAWLGGAASEARHRDACPHDQRPKIITNAIHMIADNQEIYKTSFYEDFIIHCSSENSTNLAMNVAIGLIDPKKAEALEITELNMTSVQYYPANKLDIGQYTYTCIDNVTSCEESLLVIAVPSMSVESSVVYYKQTKIDLKGISFPLDTYFVPLTENQEYEVFCSGTGSKFLQITNSSFHGFTEMVKTDDVQTDVVNETTTRHKTRVDREAHTLYTCNSWAKNGDAIGSLLAIVDYYPEAKNFECISLQWRKLECGWGASGKNKSFNLFYQDDNARTIPCVSSATTASVCESDGLFNKTVNFVMEACNPVMCRNQTFNITNTRLITKLDPPSDFKPVNISARGVALTWRRPSPNLSCEYRVEFRLQEMQWQSVNLSSVRCGKYCELMLHHLCPESLHEARVFVKRTEATKDIYWSEPASYIFKNSGKVIKKPADRINSYEMASCEMSHLASEVSLQISEVSAINKIKHTWKNKLAQIEKYRKYYKALEDAERIVSAP